MGRAPSGQRLERRGLRPVCDLAWYRLLSQQNSPQISYTDLVVGSTTTKYTSVLNAVSSALPGNTLLVTGGTGCTTGTFEILSNATITATVDRSLGTAASVCTAVLGGGFLTIPHALSTLSNASGSFTRSIRFGLKAELTRPLRPELATARINPVAAAV
jgi:hypothetical protein